MLVATKDSVHSVTERPLPGSTAVPNPLNRSVSNSDKDGNHRDGRSSSSVSQLDRDGARDKRREQRRHVQGQVSVMLEENFGGKPTGRDALIEKRREIGNRMHAASRAAEDNRVCAMCV